MSEFEDIDKRFEEIMKDDGGKLMLFIIFCCLVMPKEEFEKYMNGEKMSEPKTSTIKEDYNREVEETFDKKEDMDEIVTKAKAEFNAYVENRVHEIGIEEVKKGNVKFLE